MRLVGAVDVLGPEDEDGSAASPDPDHGQKWSAFCTAQQRPLETSVASLGAGPAACPLLLRRRQLPGELCPGRCRAARCGLLTLTSGP